MGHVRADADAHAAQPPHIQFLAVDHDAFERMSQGGQIDGDRIPPPFSSPLNRSDVQFLRFF